MSLFVKVDDYLVEHGGKDWANLLSGWADLLPASFTVWLVNRFGDAFLIFDDGSVQMLDVGAGVVKRLAESRDDFTRQIDVDDNARNWLLIPLVDRCCASGLTLDKGQCYSYRIPPMLGGHYDLENTVALDLSAHYSVLGDIFSQTKDLPDGTPVHLSIRSPDDVDQES